MMPKVTGNPPYPGDNAIQKTTATTGPQIQGSNVQRVIDRVCEL